MPGARQGQRDPSKHVVAEQNCTYSNFAFPPLTRHVLCVCIALARQRSSSQVKRWAEAHEKIARMTLTIKLDRNWSSFQLANSAPPLSVTDSAIAPSARMDRLALTLQSGASQVAHDCCLCARASETASVRTNEIAFCDRLRESTRAIQMLPQRVCCPRLCAMPVQHARVLEQARSNISPSKNTCDKQVSSWRHISCHTDKNRYYT